MPNFRAALVATLPSLALICTSAKAGEGCWYLDEVKATQILDFDAHLLSGTLKCHQDVPAIASYYNAFAAKNSDLLGAKDSLLRSRFLREGNDQAWQKAYDHYQGASGRATSLLPTTLSADDCALLASLARVAGNVSAEQLTRLAESIVGLKTWTSCVPGNSPSPSAALSPSPRDVVDWRRPDPVSPSPSLVQRQGVEEPHSVERAGILEVGKIDRPSLPGRTDFPREDPAIAAGTPSVGQLERALSELREAMYGLEAADATGSNSADSKAVPVVSPALAQKVGALSVPTFPTGMPVIARASSRYGSRNHPLRGGNSLHRGVDLAGRLGSPVYATADGTVSKASVFGSYGLYVELDHGARLETRYAHLSRLAVSEGESVQRGQVVGYVGSTGRSTGPHLHYEVRVAGVALDPAPFMLRSSSK